MFDPDERRMQQAIEWGRYAFHHGEAPYGCLIVDHRGLIVGHSWGSGTDADPTRHSEILAIQQACRARNALLIGCTLYSTHEPCAMCCGAINHAKLSRVVYGSSRADLPHLYRQYERSVTERLRDTSEPPEVLGGVLRELCIALLQPERTVA